MNADFMIDKMLVNYINNADETITKFQNEVMQNPTDAIRWMASDAVQAQTMKNYFEKAQNEIDKLETLSDKIEFLKNMIDYAKNTAMNNAKHGYTSTCAYSNANGQQETTALFIVCDKLTDLVNSAELFN